LDVLALVLRTLELVLIDFELAGHGVLSESEREVKTWEGAEDSRGRTSTFLHFFDRDDIDKGELFIIETGLLSVIMVFLGEMILFFILEKKK
jgi:hypothetical protein